MRRVLSIALATLVLAAAALLLARLPRDTRADRPSANAATAPQRSTAERLADPADDPPTLDGGERLVAERASLEPVPPASVLSTGTLRLAFVSALDRTPVAGLAFVVFRERGGSKELARGTSDVDGRAQVGGLEENVILVDCERRPPFARHVAAIWLSAGQTKELEIALDAGGVVVGRIVDDEKRPVANAEIVVLGDYERETYFETSGVAATTARDGRFRVEHMASRPQGVWIVDDAMRPERWTPAALAVRSDACVTTFSAALESGRECDVGDILLRRSITYRGRVFDADRRPVAGALVSGRIERRFARQRESSGRLDAFSIKPGLAGFRVHALETVTSAAGEFETRGELLRGAVVWTADGGVQEFELPRATPGATLEGIELVLDRAVFFDVTAVDVHGQRIDRPGPALRESTLGLPWRDGDALRSGGGVIALRLVDGTTRKAKAKCDGDGAFHFQCPVSPADCASLRFTVLGYEPIDAPLASSTATRIGLSFVLNEIPSITLRLRALSEPGGATGVNVQLQACLASPEQRRRQSPTGQSCCGRGAYLWLTWKGEARTLVLPAIERAPYWVYVRGLTAGPPTFMKDHTDILALGPFEAGPDARDIDIDLDALRAVLAPTEKPRQPPPPTFAEADTARGRISILLVDAQSGEAIEKGWVKEGLESPLARLRMFIRELTDEDGRLSDVPVPTGTWRLAASAKEYRPNDLGTVHIARDQHVDLGRVALERRPVLLGRIVNSDGTPVRGWVQLSCADDQDSTTDRTSAGGRVTLECDGREHCWLHVAVEEDPQSSASPDGVQRVAIDAWTPGEERTITLAPFHTIEVHVSGPVARRETAVAVYLCPARGEQGTRCDHALPLPADHAPFVWGARADPASGRSVFRFRIPAGHYVVYGGGLLAEVPPTEITVEDREGPQSFDVVSR